MSVLGHRVSFVEDDDLVRRARVLRVRLGGARSLAGEVLDLLADNADTSFVGGIEFQDAVSEVLWAVG